MQFEKVKIYGVKHWKENGKRRQQSREFYQTLNPFNKNAQGNPKTRKEILAELIAERDAWIKEPHEEMAS